MEDVYLDPTTASPWHAPTKIVPRNDWEGHLHDVHGAMEQLLRRVAWLERKGCHAGSELVGLHGQCLDLQDTKRGHLGLNDRFVQEQVDSRAELGSVLEQARRYAAAEVASLRGEMRAEIQRLDQSVDAAHNEDRNLNELLREQAQSTASTYATKVESSTACGNLARQTDALASELVSLGKSLEEGKASRKELADTRAALDMAQDNLRQEQQHMMETLNGATADVADLQRRFRDDLAPRTGLDTANASIEFLRAAGQEASAERRAMYAELDTVRGRLEHMAAQQLENTNLLAAAKQDRLGLSVDMTAIQDGLGTRCGILEEDLKALDRREKSSWEKFYNDRR